MGFTNISQLFQCRNRICENTRFVYTYIDSRIFVVYLRAAFSFRIVNPLAFARTPAPTTFYNIKDNPHNSRSIALPLSGINKNKLNVFFYGTARKDMSIFSSLLFFIENTFTFFLLEFYSRYVYMKSVLSI